MNERREIEERVPTWSEFDREERAGKVDPKLREAVLRRTCSYDHTNLYGTRKCPDCGGTLEGGLWPTMEDAT